MKRYSALSIIMLLAVSCSSISIDSVTKSKNPTPIDSVFIRNISIRSNVKPNIIENINKNCIFALKQKNYTVDSFIENPDNSKNYRYHASIEIFMNRIGDDLDFEESTALFFSICDSTTSRELINIRLTCSGCDLRNIKNQINIFETMVTRFDRLVKGK